MNKLLVIFGCALLSSSPEAAPQESTVPVIRTSTEMTRTFANHYMAFEEVDVEKDAPLYIVRFSVEEPADLKLDEIAYVEDDNEVDLGFDTTDYLPEGFDPYETYFDLNSIIYIEEDNTADLGFDTADYLPEGFDPYAGEVSINSINYIEDEEVDLGFDTAKYLPEGFDPYEKTFDLNAIEYIEAEEEIDLGFDPMSYLPENFDPFEGQAR
nr:hypothetical protein [Allomuricauda sp.]